jgi:hydroxymethylpyrimidine/phosphomethylpyrimidine kinase
VVLKGGHAGGERSDDTLCTDELTLRLLSARLPVQSTHGTGCTFSAALAAGLAHGLPLPAAALSAKRYITGAIAAAGTLCITRAEALASGRDAKKAEAPSSEEKGPVHHFYALWPAKVPTLLP